jgi:hypothetical protein
MSIGFDNNSYCSGVGEFAVMKAVSFDQLRPRKFFAARFKSRLRKMFFINSFRNQHLAKELLKDFELAAVIKDNERARIGDDFHGLKAI